MTSQVDFGFPKLSFSSVMRTKTKRIHRQLMVDVNWPNKGIQKSVLNKATRDGLLFEKSF